MTKKITGKAARMEEKAATTPKTVGDITAANLPAGSTVAEARSEIENKQAVELQQLGQVIIVKTADVGKAYLDLCVYIRQNKVTPKLVSYELGELGFHRVRISEINRVAMASDDNFREFAARTIGFKKVLELERGNVIEILSEASGESETEVRASIDEEKTETENTGGASGDGEETDMRSLEKAIARVLKLSEKIGFRKKQATANGYQLVLSKVKAKAYPPTKKSPAAESAAE